MEYRFYHLQRSTVESALPALLERVAGQGRRAVVVASESHVAALDVHLWTYNPASFLAHGSEKDGNPADQPVWLTSKVENPNGADVLFLLDANSLSSTEGEGRGEGSQGNEAQFTLACDLFDGNDEDATKAARARWKTMKDAGHELAYWQQTDKGWEKKTS